MRALRETGDAGRHVREGLLTGYRRRTRGNGITPARLALLAAAALLAAGLSCCRRETPIAKAPEAPSPFFQLRAGKLERLTASGAVTNAGLTETPPIPWTVQSRIADMAESGGVVYLAINGAGLASVDLGDPAQPRFTYHADPLIFRGRTITTILPAGGSVLGHLYYNAALNTVEAKDLGLRPVGLISFDPSIAEYRFHTTPIQRKDASWEPVGFVPRAAGGWLFEWKIASEDSSRFAYTRLLSDRKTEEKATRAEFMAAMEPMPFDAREVPPTLRSIFDLVLADLEQAGSRGGGPSAAVDFLVRGPGDAPPGRFRRGRPGEGILRVPVWGAGSEWAALLPRESLLRTRIGAAPERIDLPAPPPDCRYTCLLMHAGTALIGWEQTRFPDVGAAGILVFSAPAGAPPP